MSDCCVPRPLPPERSGDLATARPRFAVRPGVTFPDWSVVTSPTAMDALLALMDSDHVAHRWRLFTRRGSRAHRAAPALRGGRPRADAGGACNARWVERDGRPTLAQGSSAT
jgi:hypothetical protein